MPVIVATSSWLPLRQSHLLSARPSYSNLWSVSSQKKPAVGGPSSDTARLRNDSPPLRSPLVRHLGTVEYKPGGATTTFYPWKLALAVLTHEKWLHLLDAPSETRLRLDSPPDQVFSEATYRLDFDHVFQQKRTDPALSKWAPLQPGLTLDVSDAKCDPVDDGKVKHETYFDIAGATKSSGVLRDKHTSKWRLRCFRQEDMFEWAIKIRAMTYKQYSGPDAEEQARRALFA